MDVDSMPLLGDLDLCIMCKQCNPERSVTDDLAGKLAANLNSFKVEDLLDQDLKERLLDNGYKNFEITLKKPVIIRFIKHAMIDILLISYSGQHQLKKERMKPLGQG